jgi:hypothetical protein
MSLYSTSVRVLHKQHMTYVPKMDRTSPLHGAYGGRAGLGDDPPQVI